jgi:hypothetical protein
MASVIVNAAAASGWRRCCCCHWYHGWLLQLLIRLLLLLLLTASSAIAAVCNCMCRAGIPLQPSAMPVLLRDYHAPSSPCSDDTSSSEHDSSESSPPKPRTRGQKSKLEKYVAPCCGSDQQTTAAKKLRAFSVPNSHEGAEPRKGRTRLVAFTSGSASSSAAELTSDGDASDSDDSDSSNCSEQCEDQPVEGPYDAKLAANLVTERLASLSTSSSNTKAMSAYANNGTNKKRVKSVLKDFRRQQWERHA